MTEDTHEELEELRYLGPATAERLRAEGVEAADIRDKRISYRRLVDTGINAGVATKIRRWHSLPWTFGGEESQLDNRSKNVRRLREGEREWVAASTDHDETIEPITDADWIPSGAADESEDRSVRHDSDWTPSGAVDGVTDAEADGGVTAVVAEAAWRERSKSEPVTTVKGVTADDAERLAEARITSVRRLATADPEQVADLLDIAYEAVEDWHSHATTLDGES